MVAVMKPGDAIFNESQTLREWLRAWGYNSEIYAEGIDREVPVGEVLPYSKFPTRSSRDTLLIFHYSIGSGLTAFIRRLSIPVLLMYHNVTPSEYFEGIHRGLYEKTLQGRDELGLFANLPLALADSEFNRAELDALGYRKTGIVPLPIAEQRYDVPFDEALFRKFGNGRTSLLFVGRIAPNKKQEDVIRVFYYYRKIDPSARLFLVGSWDPCTRYKMWLDGYVKHLGLTDVHFAGHVSTQELLAYYRLADVYLSMSEHEGFGVPLAESMHFGVPVIAYASTGVPYTLGDAGILLRQKDYPVIAELIHLLVTDRVFRGQIVDRQKGRLTAFRPEAVRQVFKAYLDSMIAELSL